MRFWDTWALVPLVIQEANTELVTELRREDAGIAVWWSTRVECASAIARLVRESTLSAEGAALARAGLAQLFGGVTEVMPSETLRERAERCVLVHPLRAADALQLAAALQWADGKPAGMAFVSLDGRLREAARREGFEALPVQL